MNRLFTRRLFYCLLFITQFSAAAYAKTESNGKTLSSSTMLFIENKGQLADQFKKSRNDIDYWLNNGSFNIFIGNGYIQYQWEKAEIVNTENEKTNKRKHEIKNITYYVMKLKLVGANPDAQIESNDQQEYTENYFLSQCPNGISARSFKKIIYKNIYDNIDWVLYTDATNCKTIKYDFIVHPGGNPKDIKLEYDGATSLSLNDGVLTASTPFGKVSDQKPYSYIQETGSQIASSYQLDGNTCSFNTEAYDGTLVIDPVINWGTYYGQPDYTVGTSVAADSLGIVYLCGYTKSTVAISSIPSMFQYTYQGGTYDGFIAKFMVDGTRNWSTYFGTWDDDRINAAVVDVNGHLFIAGTSKGSGAITTPGAYQGNNGSNIVAGSFDNDAFLARFYSNGVIHWGTYFGGATYDEAFAVATDNANNVYLGGNTTSTNGIFTSGAFQSTPSNGFLAKFDVNGTRQWGTYLNGTVNAVTCDADGNVYTGGYTNATTGVATTPAHLIAFAGGVTDGYIAKFNQTGTTKIWGTYFGGAFYDEVVALGTDSSRNLYVVGATQSSTGIATSGAFRSSFAGSNPPVARDGFLTKFNKNGTQLWGTYIGDSLGADKISGIYTAPDNKVYIFGTTGSKTGIATPGNHSTTNQGPPPPSPPPSPYFDIECDAFMMKFTHDGQRKWGTYFGGNDWEYGTVGIFAGGKVYIGGYTESYTDIATPNGYQTTFTGLGGDTRGYLAQFQGDTSVYIKYPFVDTNLCAGDKLVVKYGVTNLFKSGNTFTVHLSNSVGSFVNARIIGSRIETTANIINCVIPDTASEGTQYRLRITASNPIDTFYLPDINIKIWKYHKPFAVGTDTLCENGTLHVFDANTASNPDYLWTGPNGYTGILSDVIIPNVSLAATGLYIVETNNHGCRAYDTTRVDVFPSPSAAKIIGDTTVCIGDTLHLTATCDSPGVFFQWQAPGGVPQTPDYIIPITSMADAGIYKVTPISILAYCGGDADSARVFINPLPNPDITGSNSYCSGDSIKLNVNDTTTITSHSWTGPDGFNSNIKSPAIANSTVSKSGAYIVTNTNTHGCISNDTLNIVVKPMPNVVTANSNSPVCSGSELSFNLSNGTSGASYSWTGPGSFSSNSQTPAISNVPVTGAGIYKLVADLNGCKTEDTTLVVVYQTPDKPDATSNSPVYVGEILNLKVNNVLSGASYLWKGPDGFSSTTAQHAINSVIPSVAGTYIVTATMGTCSSSDTIKVDILQKPEQVGKVIFIYPNPTSGQFTLFATLAADADVPINIYQTDGKLVHSEIAKPVNKKLEHVVDVRGKLASGIYRVKVRIDGNTHTISVVIR